MAHQHAEDNAVCSMGTSLTEPQLEQIKRLTTNVILALDPDTAGDIAMARGVEVGEQVFDRELVPVLSVNGLVRMEARLKADIRVMSLPRGQDPDEVIHEDVELWRRLVREAQPLLDYKFQQILSRHDLTQARDKAAAAAELATELRSVPDPIIRAHYVQRLATALNVGEADLKLAINQAPAHRPRASRIASEPPPDVTANGPDSSQNHPVIRPISAQSPRLDPEDFLVMRALRYLDEAHLWSQNLRTDEVVKSENREVLQFLLQGLNQATPPDVLPEAVASHVAYLREMAAREPEIPADSLPAEFELLILSLRRHNAMRKQAERATLLSQAAGGRSRDVEAAALDDLAALHLHQTELNRRTLLTRQ
jgi:DNA primase